MATKKTIFVAFAIEDERQRDFLKGQSLNTNSPFEYVDMVNFHSKCKILGGVAEFFGKAFLCRFPPEDLPRPVVYPVHSLPV